ncbi:MAG: hypothetical protein ACD_73C00787G0001 [uncultured bacterium]|nr:MAG: hypothetical protein ACD_73C00787G0001 [uncultured bacterium]
MINEKDRLKELLLEKSFEKRKVILASGRESDFYFDSKQTSLHPEGAFLLGKLFYDLIRKEFPEAQAVGGPTLGADPLATAVAIASHLSQDKKLPAFIIRKEPKKHGTQAWIEGVKNLSEGMPVVILEDVLTSGGSAKLAIEKARESGLAVKGVCVVVDREEGGRENIEIMNIPVVSLFTKTQLLS